MVHSYRTNQPEEIARGKGLFTRANFLTVLSHNANTCDLASQFRARPKLKLIDSLRYATTLNAGCRFLISDDVDFKRGTASELILIADLI
jgi:predicted nucleic acid-binding protein